MMCIKHVEKLWQGKRWRRLLRELLAERPEASDRLQVELDSPVAAAAMGMIRLDELGLTHASLFGRLLRTVLAAQEADGGWRDPMTTALCLRALCIDRGSGLAIERGMSYLAVMQKAEGIWPREPIRRLAADPFASAFILFHLGAVEAFRHAVRFDDAADWFYANESRLDEETARLWSMASLHCRVVRHASLRWEEDALLWTS